MSLHWTTILPALLIGGCVQPARLPIVVPAPAAAVPLAAPVAAPEVVTLPGAICEQARTAQTILRVQLAASRLIERVQADPAYGGAWYQHAPCYRLVLGFTDGQPRQWVIDAADAELRPYVAFGRTRFSQAEREQARPLIMAALAAAGARLEVFVVSLDPEGFMVGVPAEADARIARRAIPERYRPITRVEVGNFAPIPERARESSPDADVLRQPQLTMNQVAELQLQVIPLGQAVRQMPGFSDLYIEHEPTWHVVVAFTAPPPSRQAIVRLAPPAIRDRIVVRTARRTRAEIETALDELASALRATGLNWGGGYDVKTQRFKIKVASELQVEQVRSAIPSALRGDVDVTVGPLPVPE
ncbi:MAG TPA: hypothetical protein VFK50_04480 [Sphingomicrobium sp.]|nr:hypothetical protein [Sphingomicrobium sp.]